MRFCEHEWVKISPRATECKWCRLLAPWPRVETIEEIMDYYWELNMDRYLRDNR